MLTGRRLWTTFGLVAFVVAATGFVARFVPIVNRPLLVTAALAPLLMLGAPLAVMVFAALRRWAITAVAAALTAAVVAVQLPLYVGDDAPAGATARFVSANLRYGQADPGAVVHLAREHADVLAVQELTPALARRLAEQGIDGDFPYQALQPREGPAGVGIWSRFPITQSAPVDGFWLGLLTARVRIPGVRDEATVATTHLSAPWPDPFQGWRDDIGRLSEALQRIGGSGPVVVAGDLNSTIDMRDLRRLLADGYRDAAEQAGAGLTRTHPGDIAVPPVFAVDHFLTRGCTATAVRTLPIPGSDHRALSADIAFPAE